MMRHLLLHYLPFLVDDKGRELLREQARQALLAGVRPTLAEWRRLSALEREACVRAGEDVLRLQASTTGLASQSPGSAAAIVEPLDGGAARREVEQAERTSAMMNKAASILRSSDA